MGRTTYESIGRPLPGRTTIVLTRSTTWSADGVLVAHSIESALDLADTLDPAAQVMVAGGGEVYAAALPHADEQVLSLVDLAPDGDAFYPAYDPAEWLGDHPRAVRRVRASVPGSGLGAVVAPRT